MIAPGSDAGAQKLYACAAEENGGPGAPKHLSRPGHSANRDGSYSADFFSAQLDCEGSGTPGHVGLFEVLTDERVKPER
jgi:hypothetical protein